VPYDPFNVKDAGRAADAQPHERTKSGSPAQTPGAGGLEAPAAFQARVDRAAQIADLERQLSARRTDVRQLQLVLADASVLGRESCRPKLEVAEAQMRQLEAAIAALGA
jgi:hypothetical protein